MRTPWRCADAPQSPRRAWPTRCSGTDSPAQRWEKLAARGARLQPPLWASTSTKNPDYPDTLYVDSLIGPDTINTMAEATITAFEDHGSLARTVDTGVEQADTSHARLAGGGGGHG